MSTKLAINTKTRQYHLVEVDDTTSTIKFSLGKLVRSGVQNLTELQLANFSFDLAFKILTGTLASLPVTADSGTLYLTTDTSQLFMFNGISWVLIGS